MSVVTPRETKTTSERVIEVIAEREGVDPTDLDTPLYQVIDPDALDDLIPSPGERMDRSSIRVAFTYYGYDVVVSADDVRLSEVTV